MLTLIFLSNGHKTVQLDEGGNLLALSLRHQGGIPFKCAGGKCGTCRCRIEQGLAHTDAVKPRERHHLSEDELREGWRMACQTTVSGDVSVSWPPRPAGGPKVPG